MSAAVTASDAAVARMRERAKACPSEASAARAHHLAVVADVETGAPVTAHGQALLATLRPWADLGCSCGECLCGSTLLVGYRDAED